MPEDNENKEYTPPPRSVIIKKLEGAMEEVENKIESGRIYDAENEKVRIQWIKCLGYLANSYRSLVKDHDLEELQERIEQLERERDQGE